MTGKELYDRHVAEVLERFDADPPMRMRKDGELAPRPRPKFLPFELLPPPVRQSWDAKAAGS